MNTDTKRHIDAARQVLVGVVPNPTSQIGQITYALIYKFMDDMDQALEKTDEEVPKKEGWGKVSRDWVM